MKINLIHLIRIVRHGWKNIWLHKLRSFLTVLGIVFGVASVIAMLAIGEGASYEARKMIESLGSNNSGNAETIMEFTDINILGGKASHPVSLLCSQLPGSQPG